MAYEDNQIIITKDMLDAATTSVNAYADSGDAATLAAAKEYVDRRSALIWDEDAGEYTTDSLRVMLGSRADGLAYGVSIPKGSATACTKLGANAGIAVPTPGVIGTPAVDPYTLRGPFFYMEVNATVDSDGFPHVTGIRGDGRFARDGSNGDVWILTPTLYWRWDESGTEAVELWVSDTQLEGMGPQPKAVLPNGNLRPFMLFAKYALSVDSSGAPRSVSGGRFKNRTISHNSLISLCSNATTGYSGKSYGDDWYVKIMFLLKYATKNSQSVFAGVSSFNTQTPITVAESGTSSVIVATSAADSLPVGSALMMGTATSNPDRNSADAYSVFDGARVVSKEVYDSSNTAITVAADGAFSTSVGLIVSTAPWGTGGCDDVVGDGSPSSPTSGREPFVLQGIEMALGAYEVLGDVILSSDGSTGWQIMLNPDSRNEATSVTGVYTASGGFLPQVAADSTVWPLFPSNAAGMLFGQGTGASSSTGVADAAYIHGTSVSGTREWQSLGLLGYSSNAGVWCVHGRNTLSGAWWSVGSRLSAIGRSQG